MSRLLAIIFLLSFCSAQAQTTTATTQVVVRPILCMGDSITAGNFGNVISVCRRICEKLGAGYGCANGGRNGDSAAGNLSRWNSTFKPPVGNCTYSIWSDKWRCWTNVFVEVGVNDVNTDQTASATWASIQSLADSIRGTGANVIISRILPFKGSGWWTTTRQSVADAIWASEQTYCAAHPTASGSTGAATCVDSNPALTVGGADSLTYPAAWTTGDYLHPNQAGTDVWANQLYTLVH